MNNLVQELKLEWDETDETRFILSFEYVDVNFDIETARKLATALNQMADRAEVRRNKAVNRTIRQLESGE